MDLLLSQLNFTLIKTTLSNVAMRVSGYKNPIGLIRTAIAVVFCPVITSFLSPHREVFLRLIHSKGFNGRVAAGNSFATFPPFCIKSWRYMPYCSASDTAQFESQPPLKTKHNCLFTFTKIILLVTNVKSLLLYFCESLPKKAYFVIALKHSCHLLSDVVILIFTNTLVCQSSARRNCGHSTDFSCY